MADSAMTPDPADVIARWLWRGDTDGLLGESARSASGELLDALTAAGLQIVPTVDDETRREVENPSEPVAHRVVLEQFDGGWPYWRLDCLHGATDERWHVYCGECTDSDCGHRTHHDVCIVRPWWNEEGIELVADIDGPIVTPIPVRAVPRGEWWRLEHVPDTRTGVVELLTNAYLREADR